MDPEKLWQAARAAADAARPVTLAGFRRGLAVESKRDDYDPVTAADRDAEAAMRAVLARLRPDDGILGEEHGAEAGTSGLTWVLDPIDGTRAFVAGAPTWGTLIAVNGGAAPLCGLIEQPYVGERFEGGFGEARLWRGGESASIRTRAVASLSQAIVMSTFPEVGAEEEGAAFARLASRCLLTRYGLDCYAYALVAAGHVDLVVEAGLAPYDIQGPMAVVEGAGGIVTAWDGGPAQDGGRVIAAGCRAVHEAAMEVLAG